MKLVVHSFIMGDVEDPEIYAAEPIMEFEKTDKGQWLHTHSEQQMTFDIVPDPTIFGHRVVVHAWLTEQDYIFYQLKWG